MSSYPADDSARLRRVRTREAINLAMQSRWEEAVEANKSILEIFPTDVDALNRLGRAQTELGHYDKAREAYAQALKLDTNNAIAKRNLARLAQIKEAGARPPGEGAKVAPDIFIEETGKTGLTVLQRLGARDILAGLAPGDVVRLEVEARSLVAYNRRGDYLGVVEPKLGLRLIKLVEGGNRYTAAVAGASDRGIRIIIKEAYQDPGNAGRVSFPTKGGQDFRSYVKGSIVSHEAEGEDLGEEGETEAPAYEGERERVVEDMHVFSPEAEEGEDESSAEDDEDSSGR
ncbi:MAG: tetratricopeptide repeat protein [Chloroflexi bacterium]|nr:tetratricopeptide repeat protein [Chloroflexota bacterium]